MRRHVEPAASPELKFGKEQSGEPLLRSWPVLTAFIMVLALQVLAAIGSIDVVSAVRAYMAGESLYSKGQKDAYRHLMDYLDRRDADDYRRVLQALSLPIGDRIAREALEAALPDERLGAEGLLQSKTSPDDIPRVIRLFRWFHDTPLMSEPIAIWTTGDALVEDLRRLAEDAHAEIIGGDVSPARIVAIKAQATALNERLADLEVRFSVVLGERARMTQQVLVAINLALALLLGGIGIAFVRHSIRVQAATRLKARIEVVEARNTFLSKVSHELRSPLQSLVSALDVFELRHARAAEDDEWIRRMRRATMLLNTHLRDLLTLARGGTGRLQIHREPLEVGALVEGVRETQADAATDKNLELAVHLPEEPVFVIADGARIDQILTNLMMNAIRYTSAGSVHLTLHPYSLQDRHLKFTLSDTGRGVPEAALPTLFDPERRALDGDREGFGVGLAVVRTLVQHMGGAISVESQQGVGTVFNVQIPAEPIDPQVVPTKSRNRVLIVDDRKEVLSGLTGVLSELGYQCDSAATAALAEPMLEARDYDAVLLDIDLPVRSGTELAQGIRNGTGRNRGTLLIGMSTVDIAARFADGPFDYCLGQPIDRVSLARVLRELVANKEPLAA